MVASGLRLASISSSEAAGTSFVGSVNRAAIPVIRKIVLFFMIVPSISGSDFDDVVVDGAFDFLEPVRCAVRDHDHVTLGNHTSLSPLGFPAANFFGFNSFRINEGSA